MSDNWVDEVKQIEIDSQTAIDQIKRYAEKGRKDGRLLAEEVNRLIDRFQSNEKKLKEINEIAEVIQCEGMCPCCHRLKEIKGLSDVE